MDGRTAAVQGTSPSCLLGKQWEEPGEGKARTSRRGSRDLLGKGSAQSAATQGEDTMSKVLELSEETYQQLATLAAYQQRPLEEMLRLCLLAYEQYQYHLVHQQDHYHGLGSQRRPEGVPDGLQCWRTAVAGPVRTEGQAAHACAGRSTGVGWRAARGQRAPPPLAGRCAPWLYEWSSLNF